MSLWVSGYDGYRGLISWLIIGINRGTSNTINLNTIDDSILMDVDE